jgi:hypothetical protein
VDDLRAPDVLLELDREALGLERLLVELAEQELLGEVLRPDAQRRGPVVAARGAARRTARPAAAGGQEDDREQEAEAPQG